MPTTSFSKDITSIFNSNELENQIRYDVTCKLVCEALGVTTVSMLIYDAQTDKLKCRGEYLALNGKSNFVIEQEEIKTIVEYISVFEFFDSESPNVQSTGINDLLESPIMGETNKNYYLNEKKFLELKHLWLNQNYKSHYDNYKKTIHQEEHQVDESTLSGRYFSSLLEYGKQLTNDIEYLSIADAPQKGDSFFRKWKELGIHLPFDNLNYIGLPLFATERYTGIIRITVYPERDSTIKAIFGSTSKERESQVERLHNFAQIISLHLKTNYYLDGFRILSNLKINKVDVIKIGKEDLNEICDTITSVIRCNGCMIRFSADSEATNIPVKGNSSSLKPYNNYISENSVLTFSEDIHKILKPVAKGEKQIKAINFSIMQNDGSDVFKTIEYYYDDIEKLTSEINPGRRFRDFTPNYIADLRSFNMIEIVVLRLDYTPNGFLILTNTANRKFTRSDIEMVLLASKRIGLEIKHFQDTERINEQNKIIAQEEHAMLIVHQIGAPARALSGHAQNLNDKIFPTHIMPLKILQMNRMCYDLLRKINSLQKYLDWETKPIISKKEETYEIEKYVRSRAFQYEGLTVGTSIRIWTIIDNKADFYDDCNYDKGMFDEVLNCLLDNAVKYSLSGYEISRKVPGFNPDDPESEGHIHIHLNSTPEKLVMTIENYGCAIQPNELEKIFKRGERGKYGEKKSPTGSGIGLYVVKKVVQAFRGTIVPEHNSITSKTSFIVTLPHE